MVQTGFGGKCLGSNLALPLTSHVTVGNVFNLFAP